MRDWVLDIPFMDPDFWSMYWLANQERWDKLSRICERMALDVRQAELQKEWSACLAGMTIEQVH